MEVNEPPYSLEPLRAEHAEELWPAVDDDAMRRWWPRRWQSLADVQAQIAMQLEKPDLEPFLVRVDGIAAGSTSFYGIQEDRGRLGWTYYAPAYRRTGLNTWTKRQMLRDAFGIRGWRRVRFDVDGRNTVSQAAVERIGGVKEGVLRQHLRLWDGYIRDTVVYSILAEEWPDVEAGLRRLSAVPSG